MSRIYIEGTSLQQSRFDQATGEVPIVVVDGADGLTPDMLRGPNRNGAAMDPFADDEPLACGIENPDVCESCT